MSWEYFSWVWESFLAGIIWAFFFLFYLFELYMAEWRYQTELKGREFFSFLFLFLTFSCFKKWDSFKCQRNFGNTFQVSCGTFCGILCQEIHEKNFLFSYSKRSEVPWTFHSTAFWCIIYGRMKISEEIKRKRDISSSFF